MQAEGRKGASFRKSIPIRGDCMCKGPVVGVSAACLKKRQEVSVLKAECRESCWVTQSFPTFCNPMDHSLLGSSVYGISQARILEWVAISFSRGSSWIRNQTHVSCVGRWILYHWERSGRQSKGEQEADHLGIRDPLRDVSSLLCFVSLLGISINW